MFCLTVAYCHDLLNGTSFMYMDIPASLIPMRDVDVHVENDQTVAYVSSSTEPIALIYGVSLRENLTNVRDDYPYKNGSLWDFYTNAWEPENYPGSIPTYAEYSPNAENPYYYNQCDTLIYVYDAGTSSYVPATSYDVNTEYYFANTHYDEDGIHTAFIKLVKNLEHFGTGISADSFLHIGDDGKLYKNEGSPNVTNLNTLHDLKTDFAEGNATGTADYYKKVFHNPTVEEAKPDNAVIADDLKTLLGNNGKLSLDVATIKLTKIWNDAGNALALRPSGVTFDVYRDGLFFETITVNQADCTVSGNKWVYEYQVPFGYDYTVREKPVDGYVTTYSEDTFTVTNTSLVENTVVLDYGLPTTIDLPSSFGSVEVADITLEDDTLNFGTASLTSSNDLLYTPSSTQWNGYDTVNYTVTLKGDESAKIPGKVHIMPATNVCFEENFISFNNGGTAQWTQAGTPDTSARQDGTDTYVFGFDSSYVSNTSYSNGSSKKVSVGSSDSTVWPTATFTFFGTAVDIISYTGGGTGLMAVSVTNADTGARIKSYAVNTVYEDAGAYGDIYQIPVLRCDMAAYGHYTVTITAAYSPYFDRYNRGSYDVYLDAVRIYNPAGTQLASGAIHDKYLALDELNPVYSQLRDALVHKDDGFALDDTTSGIMYVAKDSINPDKTGGIIDDLTSALTDYAERGPNHEVYLKNTNAIAFRLTDFESKSIHISAKAPDCDGKQDSAVLTVNGQLVAQVSSATEQYYDITDYVLPSGIVVITNSGNNILSLVNYKIIGGEPEKQQIVSDSFALESAVEILTGNDGPSQAFELPDSFVIPSVLTYTGGEYKFNLTLDSSIFSVGKENGHWVAHAVVDITDSQIQQAVDSAGIRAAYTAKDEQLSVTVEWNGSEWVAQEQNFEFVCTPENVSESEATTIIRIIINFFINFIKKFLGIA